MRTRCASDCLVGQVAMAGVQGNESELDIRSGSRPLLAANANADAGIDCRLHLGAAVLGLRCQGSGPDGAGESGRRGNRRRYSFQVSSRCRCSDVRGFDGISEAMRQRRCREIPSIRR